MVHPPSQLDVDGCDTLIVSCTASGLPLQDFNFVFDGQNLVNDSLTSITFAEELLSGAIPVVIATLTICSVNAEHAGLYSCTASDGSTNDTESFTVNVANELGKIKLFYGDF